jgi:hypothetical protein
MSYITKKNTRELMTIEDHMLALGVVEKEKCVDNSC